MKMRSISPCLAVFIISFSPFAFAKNNATNPDSDKPLEIVADDSLEWHRNELYFKAKKNVRAKQGGTTLFSDILIAKYRKSKKSNIDIYIIKAVGNVQIISAKSKAYGDKAVYSVDKGLAVLTGNNLRLVSEDQIVTARDKFLYWTADGRLEAVGHALAMREGDRIEADKLTAVFVEDEKSGKRVLKTLEAFGNVIITTPEEVLTGDRAKYEANENIAQIFDNVKITKGPNILEGARAQVNLKTNVSKIFGSKEGDGYSGRVKGVFYPKATDRP